MPIEIDKIAPSFNAKCDDGSIIDLSELRGINVVLYFYPRDSTPTCTVESCNLRDNQALLKSKGFEIIGVSPDTQKKHQGFMKRFTVRKKHKIVLDLY